MIRARGPLLVSALGGATSGIVVALVASTLASKPDTSNQVAEPTTDSDFSAVRALPRDNRSRLGDLERRVDGLADVLEARHSVANGGDDGDDDTDRILDADLDAELGKAADLAWWDEALTAFENEETDPSWATRTAETFDHDLEGLSEAAGYTTIGTECRSTKCRSVVEWPSYVEATAKFGDLLHHDYRTNCARQTLLPEPSEEELGEPYRMTVVFDCSNNVDNG